MKISMNMGFVTNSSSVVHHFPKEVLDHPRVKAFLKAFEIEDGFVGEDLWHRSDCTTVALTKEQKREAKSKLVNDEYGGEPAINVDSDDVVIIYGDEYESIANTLANLMCEALAEVHGGDPWKYRDSDSYN